MREIKFRAWDTHEEVMNRVDYVDFVNGVIGMSNENVRDYEQPIHRVNIMQYTGLKDKNGVEIYEGDIVSSEWWNVENLPYKKKGEVTYVNGMYTIVYDSQFDVETGTIAYDGHSLTYAEDVEVLGNIYENPELLEREAE